MSTRSGRTSVDCNGKLGKLGKLRKLEGESAMGGGVVLSLLRDILRWLDLKAGN